MLVAYTTKTAKRSSYAVLHRFTNEAHLISQDCEDTNPLIRALAVRTMGCIRVDKITEYLCEPLRKCLKDEDPYVRKTAAVCVAKLYDISSSMVSKRCSILAQ